VRLHPCISLRLSFGWIFGWDVADVRIGADRQSVTGGTPLNATKPNIPRLIHTGFFVSPQGMLAADRRVVLSNV
jgi:hypothetical protein